MNTQNLIEYLEKFPTCCACFRKYVDWLEENTLTLPEENEFIRALQQQDFEKLNILETLLNKARQILALSEKELIHTFSFAEELLTNDHEKFHEILAEPILVVNLHDRGFSNIIKLPQVIQTIDREVTSANFTAERSGKKYAVQLKTVRMERIPKPIAGELTENSPLPYWWGSLLRNMLVKEIEENNQKVVQQLLNTKEHLSCDFTMLAFYTRRIGPAKLLETHDYVKDIIDIKKRYKEIDYVFFKDHFGEISVIPERMQSKYLSDL